MELLTFLNHDMGITIVMVTHEKEIAMYAERAMNFLDGHIDKIIHNGGIS